MTEPGESSSLEARAAAVAERMPGLDENSVCEALSAGIEFSLDDTGEFEKYVATVPKPESMVDAMKAMHLIDTCTYQGFAEGPEVTQRDDGSIKVEFIPD